MSDYNFVDNTELVELIERGLRKGYWDKALIPELKKRFKEIEKQEKLLELYRELNNKILHTYDIFGRMTNKEWKKFADIQQQIKELENERD